MSDHATNTLAATIGRSLQQAMQHRRTYLENKDDQTVKNGTVQGLVELAGAGEALVTIDFPRTFLEHPVFTCGLELAANNSLVDGGFPLWSATVVRWVTTGTGKSINYVGVELGVVVLTTAATKTVLHYNFSGQTFTNPTGSTPTLSGAL